MARPERNPRRNSRARAAAGLVVVLTAIGVAHAAPAKTAETSGAVACALRGFATDKDPKGSNIRAAPSAGAAVIGHVPPLVHISKDDVTGVEFDIVGAKDGWLLVRNVQNAEDDPSKPTAFDGPGWIAGSLVGVSLGDPTLKSAPKPYATVVARLTDDAKGVGPDSWRVTKVLACEGKYAQVNARLGKGPEVTGWTLRPCVAQLTTCDWSGGAN